MARMTRICASCGDLFYPDEDDHNTICAVGKSMFAEFFECDECISKAEYEEPTQPTLLTLAK